MDNKNAVKKLIIYPGVIFGILLFCFVGSFFEDLEVNSPAFRETRCVVLGQKVVRSGVRSSAYYPMLQLGYVVNQQPYNSWTHTSRTRSTYFFQEFFFENVRTRLTDDQESHPVGSVIPCWYKVSDHKIVVTEKGYHIREALILLIVFYNWMMLVVIGTLGARQRNTMESKTSGRVTARWPFYFTCMSILSAISIMVLIYAIFGM